MSKKSKKITFQAKSPEKKLTRRIKDYVKLIFQNESDTKYDYKLLSQKLQIKDSQTRKVLITVLYQLKDEKFIREVSKGLFSLNQNTNLFEGILEVNSKGFGFVSAIKEFKDDIYIKPENLNQALHGDTVRIKIIDSKKGRPEGFVNEVIQRKTQYFVGTITVKDKFAFIETDNPKITIDIYIPIEKLNKAKNGEKVVGRITSWPKETKNPFGEVVEVLGQTGANTAEMLSILIKHGLDYKFPQLVIAEAENIGIELDQKEIDKRRDMRETITFTIDPIDAKDFDDALSYKKLPNGSYEVGVHIADVSHYVKPNSELDKEALKRGNSIYLVDRVIPMLPEQLSNIACSLRPNEDKFTFSVVFEMTPEGKILSRWYGKTVIHSDYRFTYEAAQEIIEGSSHQFEAEIRILDSIAKKYRKNRLKNGALNVESEEIKFQLNESGNPIDVYRKTSKDAHKLVEEFMLLANKEVALYVGKNKGEKTSNPNFVYRVHDKPDAAKIETLKLFISKFGFQINTNGLDKVANEINNVFSESKNSAQYELIQSMAIRSMAKASYDTKNIGHFGLAFDFYTHFTSPIRRYADLMVHRLLLHKLNNAEIQTNNLAEKCKHISIQERKAIDAERESNKFFQVKFLSDKVGQIFEGKISGLTDFGLFVKINENACEGLIAINKLPGDRYYFDHDQFRIIGRRTGQEYNFGDPISVQVVGVDFDKKQIDLEVFDF